MAGRGQIHKHPKANTNGFDKNPQNRGKGRKKKIYTILKDKGYSADDIKTAFGEMAWYNLSELQKLFKDEETPIIIRIVANQFYLALKKGDMVKIAEIMAHVIGRAPASVDIATKEVKIQQVFKIGDQEIEF